MLRKNEVVTAVGTLCCAMGIGFVMQNSEEAAQRYGTAAPVIQASTTMETKGSIAENSLLDVQEIILTSAEFEPDIEMPVQAVLVEEPKLPQAEPVAPKVLESDAVVLCDITAMARPIAAAMVDLKLSAPCLMNEPVTVHHSGMIFNATTSDHGTLSLKVPALTEKAVFILAFSTGEGAVATTEVKDLAQYSRAVLQWKGTDGFELHAREFGAAYGEPGHRWADMPGDLVSAVAGTSGVLTRHGNAISKEPLMAEVYTFPRNTHEQSGEVLLTVEAEVTPENCGMEVEAQALQMQPDGKVRTKNLILPVPSCDSVGSFLVLNNLLQDVKVAAN